MELGAATSRSEINAGFPVSSDSVTQRLDELLRLNSAKARENALYRTDAERTQAALMSRPLRSEKVFAYFGLMIASMPVIAVILKAAIEATFISSGMVLLAALLSMSSITSGLVGYASGKHVSTMIERASSLRRPNDIAAVAAIGFCWGAVAGAAGGSFLFIIGAAAAGLAGGAVGAVTLPILYTLHSVLRVGDFIELKHFLPISLGITLSLCALILGL